MSMKLKALSLGLLAMTAMCALAVMNASATPSGHFESEIENTTIEGTEAKNTAHELQFRRTNSEGVFAGDPITCKHSTYKGVVGPKTVTSVQVTPTYTECTTPDNTKVPIHVNGCSYTFNSHGANTHGTVTIDCPLGKAIEITHPNCTITVGEQAPTSQHMLGGATFTTDTKDGKHSFTVDITVRQITSQFHGGICIFLGTNHTFDMNGTVTVWGHDGNNNPVGITHT